MTLELYEELEVKHPFNANSHQSILMSNSSIGGKTIDRCSPHLRDPLRAKYLSPLHSQIHNKPRSSNFNLRGKKKASEKRTNELLYISPASSQRYLLSATDNSEDFLEHETFPCVIEKYDPKVEESNAVVEKLEGKSVENVKVEESNAVVGKLEEKSVENSKVEESNAVVGKLEEKSVENLKVEEYVNDSGSSSSSIISEIKQKQPVEVSKMEDVKSEKDLVNKKTISVAITEPKEQQVVVLRVSLHCKGCEGKVRKHISKMEGVTSFKTDLKNKKVTVVGDVTPLSVLNSISKVKNAQLWSSQGSQPQMV